MTTKRRLNFENEDMTVHKSKPNELQGILDCCFNELQSMAADDESKPQSKTDMLLTEQDDSKWSFTGEKHKVRIYRHKMSEVSGLHCSKGVGIIEATPQTVFSFLSDLLNIHLWTGMVDQVRMLKEFDQNTNLIYLSSKGKYGVNPRDFVVVLATKKLQDGTFIIMFRSISSEFDSAEVTAKSTIRGELKTSGFVIRPIKMSGYLSSASHISLIIQYDGKGTLPAPLLDKIAIYIPLRIARIRNALPKEYKLSRHQVGKSSDELSSFGSKRSISSSIRESREGYDGSSSSHSSDEEQNSNLSSHLVSHPITPSSSLSAFSDKEGDETPMEDTESDSNITDFDVSDEEFQSELFHNSHVSDHVSDSLLNVKKRMNQLEESLSRVEGETFRLRDSMSKNANENLIRSRSSKITTEEEQMLFQHLNRVKENQELLHEQKRSRELVIQQRIDHLSARLSNTEGNSQPSKLMLYWNCLGWNKKKSVMVLLMLLWSIISFKIWSGLKSLWNSSANALIPDWFYSFAKQIQQLPTVSKKAKLFLGLNGFLLLMLPLLKWIFPALFNLRKYKSSHYSNMMKENLKMATAHHHTIERCH